MTYARDFAPESILHTHQVLNQPLPLGRLNAYAVDTALREAVAREGGAWAHERLIRLGDIIGDPANVELATACNRHGPELRRFDAGGRRVDTVEFHPAWHQIMALAWEHGLPSAPWADPKPGAHVAKAAASILFNQLESGCMCPVAITYGTVPMLRRQTDLAAHWEPALLSRQYDGRPVPAAEKSGITAAFAVTEKQGGSDLRGCTTSARPVGAKGPGREYLLTGHKWFVSSAGADIIIASAATDKGVSLFLLPRFLPDRSRNNIRIERIKEKMGNVANASVELELDDAHGWMVGDDGRGIAMMMVFMQYSRFEVALMPAGLMRATLVHSLYHASRRSAFGRRLLEQPLMRNVLADLAIEYEASVALSMRVARANDEALSDERQRAFARLAVAVAKYWQNKRCVGFVQEAMEIHGGNGYIEESVIPRYYREAAVNNIWEGAGNVLCLDILRTLRSEPQARDALMTELDSARGSNALLDRECGSLYKMLSSGEVPEHQARLATQRLALCLQGALLQRDGDPAVADTFCESRFGGDWSGLYGGLSSAAPVDAILRRSVAEGVEALGSAA